MKLIVTEKDSAAQKIAEILGAKVTVKEHGRARQKVRSYWFRWRDSDAVAIGLRGHVMETVFPDAYRRWSLKYLEDMIRAPDLRWIVDAASAGTVAALRAAAKGADEVIVATDYDREGELIGHEALVILRGDALRRHPRDKGDKARRGGRAKRVASAPDGPDPLEGDGEVRLKAVLPTKAVDRHHRARYSALTPTEVESAFSSLSTLDFNLAEAAHTRQDIDLIWGAVLTRFMSLASYRYGSEYLSIGRVQTPTLRLVVDRELERRAFVPVPYWELKAELEAGGGERFTADHAKGRFAALDEATAALAAARSDTATVTAWDVQPRSLAPPPPFNTTALMSAASGTGVSPSRAMRAAESLYLEGLISYPRTDNTVYPSSLDLHAILQALSAHGPVGAIAADLAARPQLKPTRGKKRTTDHPPVHPVGVPERQLSGDAAKVYDLVVRRFLATLLPAAVIESQRADLRLGSEPFVARGSRVAKAGFLRAWRPYTSERERPLPQLAVGDALAVVDLRQDAKETQPPGRYGQGPLIEKMEELGLGTKATRADIIQHLYDRNYVRGNPVEPTELGIAVIKAFDVALRQAPLDISSPAMTAKLESEMDAIAVGDVTRERVVGESQEMLLRTHQLLETHLEQIREAIKGAVREDLTLGTCSACGGELRVLRGKTGKRFVACVGKPDEEPKVPEGAPPGTRPRRGCGQTFPLPQRGAIMPLGTTCSECGWPEIKVLSSSGRGRPWQLCLDPDCPSKTKHKRRATRRS
jgi:DNA topoisomerase-1